MTGSRRARHFPAIVLFLLLTGVLTNPLVIHLWNGIEDKQDALLNTWILAWVGHALTTSPLHLFDGNIFFPYPDSLAFSELNLPQSLLALPITFAAGNPLLGYNLVVLGGLFLDAFGMYLLALDLTRRSGPALLAGMIYAFNPYNLGNLAQEQLLWLGFLPLAVLAHRRIALTERGFPVRQAVLLALFFSLQMLASIYYGMFAALTLGLYTFVEGAGAWRRNGGRKLAAIGLAGVLSAMVLAPLLLPYFRVQRELGFERRLEESEPFSASFKLYTEVSPANVLYGARLAPQPPISHGGYPLDNLFPGLGAVLLAAVGIVSFKTPRDRIFLAALLVTALVLSFGPRLYTSPGAPTNLALPYGWLYQALPVLRALRAPVRLAALVMFSLALLAAGGLARILSALAGRRGGVALALTGLVLLAVTAEYLNLPAAGVVLLPAASGIPEVYRWLQTQPEGVILEVPMMGPDAQGKLDLSNEYYTTYHWQRTPDGYSGFVPPRRGEIAYEMQSLPGERGLALLARLEVRYLIVHAEQLGNEASALLGKLDRAQGLERVGQFGEAHVYRVTYTGGGAEGMRVRGYLPNPLAAGAPFQAWLILQNQGDRPFAARPTDKLALTAKWNDGRVEEVSVALPLVTSTDTVVPVPLQAPAHAGPASVELRSANHLAGDFDWSGETTVGASGAREVLIAAHASLGGPKGLVRAAPGGVIEAEVLWRVDNKVDAYYSASLRLVDGRGEKAAAIDRQPQPPTLLWTPGQEYADRFRLELPHNLARGHYRLEMLMYQADEDRSVLLLDEQNQPTPVILLAEVEVQ